MKIKTKFEFCIKTNDKKICWDAGEVFEVLQTKQNKYGSTVYVVEKEGTKFELATYEVTIL